MAGRKQGPKDKQKKGGLKASGRKVSKPKGKGQKTPKPGGPWRPPHGSEGPTAETPPVEDRGPRVFDGPDDAPGVNAAPAACKLKVQIEYVPVSGTTDLKDPVEIQDGQTAGDALAAVGISPEKRDLYLGDKKVDPATPIKALDFEGSVSETVTLRVVERPQSG